MMKLVYAIVSIFLVNNLMAQSRCLNQADVFRYLGERNRDIGMLEAAKKENTVIIKHFNSREAVESLQKGKAGKDLTIKIKTVDNSKDNAPKINGKVIEELQGKVMLYPEAGKLAQKGSSFVTPENWHRLGYEQEKMVKLIKSSSSDYLAEPVFGKLNENYGKMLLMVKNDKSEIKGSYVKDKRGNTIFVPGKDEVYNLRKEDNSFKAVQNVSFKWVNPKKYNVNPKKGEAIVYEINAVGDEDLYAAVSKNKNTPKSKRYHRVIDTDIGPIEAYSTLEENKVIDSINSKVKGINPLAKKQVYHNGDAHLSWKSYITEYNTDPRLPIKIYDTTVDGKEEITSVNNMKELIENFDARDIKPHVMWTEAYYRVKVIRDDLAKKQNEKVDNIEQEIRGMTISKIQELSDQILSKNNETLEKYVPKALIDKNLVIRVSGENCKLLKINGPCDLSNPDFISKFDFGY